MSDLEVVRRAAQRRASLEERQYSRRILRRHDVQAATGLSRTAIYKLMAQGAFPRPVPLTRRSVGWISDEVDAFIQGRITARDAKSAA